MVNRLILVLITLLLPLSLKAQHVEPESSSTLFFFQSGSNRLLKDYLSNRASFEWLDSEMQHTKEEVLMGREYFEILAFVETHDAKNPESINRASIEGSILRAYLKTQYSIDHHYVTFKIDTTQNLRNVVQLRIVSGSPATYANRQIHYTLRPLEADFLEGYINGVPYQSNLLELFSKSDEQETLLFNLEDSSEVEAEEPAANYNLYVWSRQSGYQRATSSQITAGTEVIYYTDANGRYIVASSEDIVRITQGGVESKVDRADEPQVEVKPIERSKVFGLKTNVLYLAALLPNIESEFYLGSSRLSLGLKGAYTYAPLWAVSGGKDYRLWSAGGDIKYWTNPKGDYTGLYLGLGASYGEYNIGVNDIEHRGNYILAGLTLGYLLPLTDCFGLEFAVGAGYINYENFKRSTTGAFQEIRESVHGFVPTEAKISVVWQF